MARAAPLALLALLAAAASAAAQSKCAQIPNVDGADQSPSDPANYGKCTGALEKHVLENNFSHWCKFNQLGLVSN